MRVMRAILPKHGRGRSLAIPVVLFATLRRRVRDSKISVISNPSVALPSFLQCLGLFSKELITYQNKQASKLDFKLKQKITIKGRPTPGLKGLLQTTVQKRTNIPTFSSFIKPYNFFMLLIVGSHLCCQSCTLKESLI